VQQVADAGRDDPDRDQGGQRHWPPEPGVELEEDERAEEPDRAVGEVEHA
jgi:hypothetical protein